MFGLLILAEFAIAIYLLVDSPKKLQTLGRMVLAFVIVLVLTMVPPALFRRGDPRAWGHLAGVIAPLVSVIVGWLNVRSLRHSAPAATSSDSSS